MTATPSAKLRSAAFSFMSSSVLAAAGELDCFTWIIAQGNSACAESLSQGIKTDLRGTEVLLDALAATGFLLKVGVGAEALYSVPDEYLSLLDSRHPESFVPMLRHMANSHRSWARLTWSVKDGKPQERQPSILGPEEDCVSFISAMNSVALQLVKPTMASLKEAGLLEFSKANPRILDVGGASGTYARALLEALPQALVTVFDLPTVIEQAKKRFAGSEFADRIGFAKGDFTQDTLPTDYDFVWLSAIIHMLGREECVRLYRNIHQALNHGGMIAVRDYFMSPNRLNPPDGTLFGVNMLVHTSNGMVYTFEESKEDLEQAGFVDVRLAVPSPGMSAVVSARKG